MQGRRQKFKLGLKKFAIFALAALLLASPLFGNIAKTTKAAPKDIGSLKASWRVHDNYVMGNTGPDAGSIEVENIEWPDLFIGDEVKFGQVEGTIDDFRVAVL